MNPNTMVTTDFPREETLNSFLERSGKYHFGQSFEKMCRKMLDRGHSLGGLPGSIKAFCAATENVFGDEDAILSEHVLYDFCCCGLRSEDRLLFRERLLEGPAGGPLWPARLPVLFPPSRYQCLRCEQCDEVARDSYGFTFVDRRTTAPFVTMCPIHHERLRQRRTQHFDDGCRALASESRVQRALEFADRIYACVDTLHQDSGYERAVVKDCLTTSGWITETGRLRVSSLVQTFSDFFAGGLGDIRLDQLCNTQSLVEAAVRRLIEGDRPLHTVWCVLLKWFGENCQRTHFPRPQPNAFQKQPKLDIEETRRIVATEPTLTSAAERLHVSTTFLSVVCSREAIPFRSTPRKVTDARRDSVLAHIKLGLSVADIATRTQLSQSSIYRIRASIDVLKEAHKLASLKVRITHIRQGWQETWRQHPNVSASELRRLAPHMFATLYRYDRAWLKVNSPPPQQPSWRHNSARRDEELKRLLLKSIDMVTCDNGGEHRRPRRSARYQIAREIGASEYAVREASRVDTGPHRAPAD